MDYSQLHRAVDQLSPDQAEALLIVVDSMLGKPPATESMLGKPPATESADAASAIAGPPQNRLSFTAAGDGPADLAENVENYLRFGVADASVIAVAERLGITQLATIDHRHMRAVRPAHCPAFEILPE